MPKLIFKKISNDKEVARYIANLINKELAEAKSVIWLVPGGSAAKIAADASRLINPAKESLLISLTDERPGVPGHADSNWRALLDAGFDINSGSCYEVLRSDDTIDNISGYREWLSQALEKSNYRIGLFGVGVDGHTAGILPDAQLTSSAETVHLYKTATKTRISITPRVIANLDLAIVYAVGEDKARVLDSLNKNINPVKMPAQYLKTAKQLIIYNDSQG